MVTVSFDPDARTLYWYFVELEEGASAEEGECAAALLLDGDGQVIGCELELDESVAREDLALALRHPQVRYQAETFTLTVLLADETPATVQPLAETAILDFDAAGSLLGCELVTAPEFELAERLRRLAPFMVSLDEEEDQGPEPALSASEGTGDRGLGIADDELRTEDREPGTAEAVRPEILQPSAFTLQPFKSGFVAIIGRPNVGKSTLLNALLGQKVAIVSRKPQTTRTAIRGVLNRPGAQVVFVDTPGIHQPRNRLGSFMVEQARRSIPDADVICFMVDISEPPGRLDRRIAAMVRRSRAPKLLVLNKVDRPTPHGPEHLQAYRELGPWDMELAISALHGEGLEALVEEIVRRLPEGPPLYPEGQVTDQSERELAAELVREQVLRHTEEEVPHGVAVEVEEWEQRERALYIRMTIYVEKESQKGILIGAGGAMLKKIGSNARHNIERALGQPVFLDLWVKPRPNWRDDPSSLRWLGYRET
ncbi:MAG TPA: GTPase Era [Roseiflexaceae bacterium]|nr:GTPase Era [Roseiflexaceae bacterium]